MANALSTDLTGKTVLLKSEAMNPQYRGDRKWRIFVVEGGFGASPATLGSALLGTFKADGEKARVSGYDVEAIVCSWCTMDGPVSGPENVCPACAGMVAYNNDALSALPEDRE